METKLSKVRITKSEDANGVQEMVFKYLPYWPIFLIFLILSLFGAWFYLRTAQPQYEITASLMVKDEKKGAGDGQAINALNQLSEKRIVENEMEILHSRTLMNNVVKNLGLYANFFQENKLRPQPAYTTSPIKIYAPEPDKIAAAEKVPFTYKKGDSTIQVNGKTYPFNKTVDTDYGRLRFIKNPTQDSLFVPDPSAEFYFTLSKPEHITADLLGRFTAEPSNKLTSVLSMSLKDGDPQRGEDILNELISAYHNAAMDEKNRLADSTTSFVEDRLKIVKQELDDIEKNAQHFKTRGAVDISTQGQILLQNMGATDQQMSDVNMQMSVLDQVEKYVKSKNDASGITPSTLGLKDGMLPNLLTQLNTMELEYEKLSKTTGENNPMMVSLKGQIDRLRPSIAENIANQRASLQAAKLNLNATANSYASVLSSIPQKERELIDISRQQNIKSNQYAFLLQKKEESELAQLNTISDTRLIDEAQASFSPVSPNSKLIYAAALFVAFGIPVGFLFVKSLFNQKVMFRKDIEKITSIPIIGEVAFQKSKDPVVVKEGNRTFIAEQFRKIRTSLGFRGGEAVKRKILVTSTLPSEGKSFVALNLSLSLALTGKKVVLLEFDLANPSLSIKMNVNYEGGASDYLRGKLDAEDIIKRTSHHENLFFVPAGTLAENPSELLLTDKTKDLLAYLSDIFDIIVIDSAPSSLLSDAHVLSPMCDTTLYVVKHGQTPRRLLERLDEEAAENLLVNVRIVFNGVKARGFSKYGYGYGYGYGYVYKSSKKNPYYNKTDA